MSKKIPIIGVGLKMEVCEHNEFLSNWKWYAIHGTDGVDGAAVIEGQPVVMSDLTHWADLVRGVRIAPDGSLVGEHTGGPTGEELQQKLESTLRHTSMWQALHQLVREARIPATPPVESVTPAAKEPAA